jgi:hypothetical protein
VKEEGRGSKELRTKERRRTDCVVSSWFEVKFLAKKNKGAVHIPQTPVRRAEQRSRRAREGWPTSP